MVFDCVAKVLCAEEIKGILHEILLRTYNYGFQIGLVISDGASANRLVCKQMFTFCNPHGDTDELNSHMPTFMDHPCSGEPVFSCPDPSHVIKKLVNSLDNPNHKIFMANPLTPGVEPTVQLTLGALYKLFLNFEGGNGLRMFRFNRNYFIKTPFEKMRVGPSRAVMSVQMLAMLDEADRCEKLFVDNNDSRYASFVNIRLLTGPMRALITSVNSVFDIMDRRKMPGLSANPNLPTHVAELETIRKAAEW
jgi:hypothetical protein